MRSPCGCRRARYEHCGPREGDVEPDGDDARKTLVSTGRLVLLKDAIVRLRAGDGTSHARSLAFLGSLVLMQALVAVVGFAIAFGSSGVSSVIVDTVRASAPGEAETSSRARSNRRTGSVETTASSRCLSA